MKIETDNLVSFPRALCFETYRDRIVELVPYLPNVQRITVLEREDAYQGGPAKVRLVNEWRAVSDIPKVARPILKPEMLAWRDTAVWDEDSWTCEWRVETHFFKERVSCRGKNLFVDKGGKCLFQIRGHLDIDLAGLPGVPRLVGDKVGAIVEKFVVAVLTPNLTSVSQGVEAFLRKERAPA